MRCEWGLTSSDVGLTYLGQVPDVVQFDVALRPQRPQGLLWMYWGQDGHLDFHTLVPEFWNIVQVQYCFTSTGTIRTIRDGEPRKSTSTFTQLLSSVRTLMMKWCLMSSDVSWHIRDKLWPMPKYGSINLYVHGNQKASLGRTAQDGHFDSHTAPELYDVRTLIRVHAYQFLHRRARALLSCVGSLPSPVFTHLWMGPVFSFSFMLLNIHRSRIRLIRDGWRGLIVLIVPAVSVDGKQHWTEPAKELRGGA